MKYQPLKLKTLISMTIFTGLMAISTHSSAGDYDDWWICANQCSPEDAQCVDACTDEYNSTHTRPIRPGKLKLRSKHQSSFPLKLKYVKGSQNREPLNEPVFHHGQLCPEGTFPSYFDMPIYDEDEGLFVVGHEPVLFCLDEDLEPAG